MHAKAVYCGVVIERQRFPADRRRGALETSEERVFFRQNADHRRRGEDPQRLKFAQVQKTHHGIDVRARQHDGRQRSCSRVEGRSEIGIAQKLLAEVGRSVEQNPRAGKRGNGNLGLRARPKTRKSPACAIAVGASAIPLRKPTARGRAEDLNFHSVCELEFSVSVRADFAVQIDYFMLRCGPFHGRSS